MIWLLLSVLASTAIFVVFRLFGKYQVNNLQAIIVNYLVAFLLGHAASGFSSASLGALPQQSWFPNVLLLGFLFITLFQLMAWVSQNFGVAAVSVAVKMSVIIPIAFGIWYYSEALSWIRGLGFILALAALFLATYKPGKLRSREALWFLPFLLFLGSGFLDAFINYNEATYLKSGEHALFATAIFGMAALFGFLFLGLRMLRQRQALAWKSIWGGIALGVPNYGSIYFVLRALDQPELSSSVVFALNHVAIVALSTILGVGFFREHFSRANQAGLALSIISILLIYRAI